ncbi:hypothetical protein NA57DRAFT_54450 [Rhizodiscina lignyota]|uniref:DNA/RNA-binding protein Alba-like domain-containing protein n=1 Tax=Rhizodiscina lignyota TaxID=1504668 RepID=A0A9P4IIQ1_9PEZI|nr:hypothetical protein NA57DRAFT_54450 [Rhizodiscina lignyota]
MVRDKRSAEADAEDLDDEPTTTTRKQKTGAKQWVDGDSTPQFAFPNAPQQSNPLRGPTPPTIASVSHNHPLTAPHMDKLSEKYHTDTITITRNCTIRSRVAQLLQLLKPVVPQLTAELKQTVIALSAREDAANKLISVVEIVKRELDVAQQAWFQYTGAWGRMEQLKKKGRDGDAGREQERRGDMLAKWGPGRRLKDGKHVTKEAGGEEEAMEDADAVPDVGSDDDEDGDDAFETMVQPERDKVRQIPVITIYMSRGPVPELRQLFG